MQTQFVLISGLSLVLLTACSQSTDSHTTEHEHSHSNAANGYWPPQLDGMTNQQALPPTGRTRARNSVLAAARSSLLNNPAVREALGPVISEYNASLGDPKSNTTATFLFYNYSLDQTIEASLLHDGSIALQSYEASVFQPTENGDEVVSAINMAKIALESTGYDTAGLTGTAMLAYPSANETQSLSETFYPERVLYVTFGPGEGELPDYRALVNLSTATVSDFGSIK